MPEAARNIMVQQAGLSLGSLLQDPAQQLSNSYVSGNPHKWVDPLGLNPLIQGGTEFISGRVSKIVDDVIDNNSNLPDDQRSIISGMAGGAVTGGVMVGVGGFTIAGPGGAFAGSMAGAAYGGLTGLINQRYVKPTMSKVKNIVSDFFSEKSCKN